VLVTASIGVTLYPHDDHDTQRLVKNADIAMYQAKDKGRNGWHIFSPDEKARERLNEWLLWEEMIKRGMAENIFELHFQPVMFLSQQIITHFEILLRLPMPDGTIATPVQLLDIAERSSLIRELDLWVVRKAIAYVASLTTEYDSTIFTINLSGVSIGDETLLESVKSLFDTTDIDPRRIIFEITETAAVADLAHAREFITAVKSIGCSFALDDFGSGFAGFYYLRHFPVDYIKIDGSFIINLTDSLDDQILVRAMVEIAKAYGKKTVAEFVENENTLNILQQYGVDYVQGYYIGKPAAHLATLPNYFAAG
jgi:EAL domain-containing protein (putative c-di-GMP-specific phosphodiesterase class I)